ncbi:MAG: LysR substrate-binding domain-containing protein [Pseudomonadota bacterium]
MNKPARTPLRGLRTFCLAARYESFRAAAEALFVTPSAVSHQIKTLESQLGITLFRRRGGEVSLTEAGQALYEDLAPLINEVDAVVSRYETGAAAQETVRVSVQPFFASEYFVPRLKDFTAQHAEIDIRVGTSDEASEKHPADADLSVRLFSAPPEGLAHERLFPLRLVPAGSPEFKASLKVSKKRITSDFPLIVHETLAKAWPQWSESSGIALPAQRKSTQFDSMIAVVRAAQRHLGAALVPMPMGELWFEEGSLVRLFKQELLMQSAYYLVWKSGVGERRSVRLLRDWILETFREAGEKNSSST